MTIDYRSIEEAEKNGSTRIRSMVEEFEWKPIKSFGYNKCPKKARKQNGGTR